MNSDLQDCLTHIGHPQTPMEYGGKMQYCARVTTSLLRAQVKGPDGQTICAYDPNPNQARIKCAQMLLEALRNPANKHIKVEVKPGGTYNDHCTTVAPKARVAISGGGADAARAAVEADGQVQTAAEERQKAAEKASMKDIEKTLEKLVEEGNCTPQSTLQFFDAISSKQKVAVGYGKKLLQHFPVGQKTMSALQLASLVNDKFMFEEEEHAVPLQWTDKAKGVKRKYSEPRQSPKQEEKKGDGEKDVQVQGGLGKKEGVVVPFDDDGKECDTQPRAAKKKRGAAAEVKDGWEPPAPAPKKQRNVSAARGRGGGRGSRAVKSQGGGLEGRRGLVSGKGTIATEQWVDGGDAIDSDD